MNIEVFDLLDKGIVKNSLAFPFWVYNLEIISVANQKYFKIYLFNRLNIGRELESIVIENGGKEYSSSSFSQVSKYNDSNIIGTAVQIPIGECLYNFKIVKEIVDGREYLNDGLEIVYSKKRFPSNDSYLMDKFPYYKANHLVYPAIESDYWQCSCGRIHDNETAICMCGISKEQIENILNFDFQSSYIEDYTSKPIVFNLNKTFEENIQEYKDNFKRRYSADSEEMIKKINLDEEETRYNELLKTKQENDIKAAKKKKRTLIIVGLAIFLTLFSAFMVKIGIPEIRYWQAEKCLENGEYDKSIEIFDNLNYKDSNERVPEVKYAKADSLVANEQYEEALDIFDELSGSLNYADSFQRYCETKGLYAEYLYKNGDNEKAYKELEDVRGYGSMIPNLKDSINQYGYAYALELLEEKNYKDAINILKDIPNGYEDNFNILRNARVTYAEILYNEGNYEDAYVYIQVSAIDRSEELYKTIVYEYGSQLVSSKKASEAIKVLNNVVGYKDTNNLLKEAKYLYITQHKNNTDKTTYQYLKDLKAIGYKDSASIFKKLYAWEIEVYPVANSNSTIKVSSFSKYDDFTFYVKLSGGEPDSTARVSYKMTFPDGDVYNDSWDGYWSSGTSSHCWGYYTKPAYGTAGTFSISIYVNGVYTSSSSATIRSY